MDIAQLTLRSLVFELRYPHAFYLWDRSGAIASAALSKWPELKLRDAAPNQVTFRLGRRLEFAFQIERCFAALSGAKVSLDELTPFISFLADLVLSDLEVPLLNRVGFKVTFLKEYKSTEAAVAEFFDTGILKHMEGKNFNVDGHVDLPNVSIRFEGEHVGCAIVLQVRKRKLEVDIPFIGDDFPEVNMSERNELVFECDYFTTKKMNLGQFRAARWTEEALHVIRRDSGVILGR